ncbi:hypothetical protein [Sinorhizobium psoraleae]|uniref:Uncharacterized protein n=1 Tax=Sinorhizobium psoraleae TaxID=520838 RepID=A0ABT4KND1_9HYPH|nr:hypothetical protein [Sinorhizobium psoraleae]MCZ4093461.1 hypothetical protein [Sinorhizobium psoraleae]
MTNCGKPVGFAEVKAILDLLVQGREDNLSFVHGDAFGWADKAMLVSAVARPFGADPAFRLIDPSLVGVGRAKETNIYIALTAGIGGFERMPFGGPYATPEQLALIAEWIDNGMPD